MHETTVAQSLVEAISREARSRSARPIRAKMSCGQLNAVNDEVLCFAFAAVARGTVCEDMELQIEHKPLRATCAACDRALDVVPSEVKCPHCGSTDLALLPDAPLILEQIEFEGAEDGEG